MLLLIPLALALSASRCSPPVGPAEGCTGSEDCGTTADCSALCATVERLGCSDSWGIDPDDGSCLALCQSASPGLCPRLASRGATCAEIDRATECGK
jgi:hypothetical protein